MDYYSQLKYLIQVDKQDNFIGPVERWQAHKQAILHRGFTVVLLYNNRTFLQQRKHPAFDGLYDLSFSSHPMFIENKMQSMETAIYNALKREWGLEKSDLKTELKLIDRFYYKAKDPNSIFIEHEIDYLYFAQLKKLPKINPSFAYGYELIDIKPFTSYKLRVTTFKIAPWVYEIIESKFFLKP